jgi:hypothetical protein
MFGHLMDGHHPNTAGQKLIAARLLPQVIAAISPRRSMAFVSAQTDQRSSRIHRIARIVLLLKGELF